MLLTLLLTPDAALAAGRSVRSRPRCRVRSFTVAFVAFALAVMPTTSPLMPAASAQAPPNPGELSKYGAVPQAASPATTPPTGTVPTYSAIGGAPPPASPSLKPPELGDSSQTMMSPAQERKLGEAIVRQIRGGGGYLDDPEVNDYLNEIGNRPAHGAAVVR